MTDVQCSYKACGNPTIGPAKARVEVRAARPTKLPAKCKVNWSRNGDAVFHRGCWELLWNASNKRSKKQALLTLSRTERQMIDDAADTAEFHDEWEKVKKEAARVADMITSSKYCVAFTGAGLSTSAGIGDYRGKSGKWTEDDRALVKIDIDEDGPSGKRARLDSGDEIGGGEEDEEEEEDEGVNYESLRPTYSHEALQKLMDLGHLKFIISQNGDGLHGLSGVPLDKLSELHGNVFMEKCEQCGHCYTSPHYVMDDVASQYFEEMEDYGQSSVKKPRHAKKCDLCGLNHRTGRKCQQTKCKGFLQDTIINFRDNLEEEILTRAENEALESDLMLCLGTTLMVTPANRLVKKGKRPLRLVICNRQETDCDKLCSKPDKAGQPLGCRVFGDCDRFMCEVMKGILTSDDLETWEGQRASRLEEYDKLRVKPE